MLRAPLLRVVSGFVVAQLLALGARAQLGVLDQISPTPGAGQNANFAVSNPAQVWQQQVRAGVGGTLTAVELQLTGPASARAHLRVRPAAGWSSAAPVFQTLLHKSASGAQTFVVDLSSANFQVAVGQAFVLELVGDGSLAGVNGSYVSALQGAPQYAEPLFLSGPNCYSGCGWRIGFRTWVKNGDVTEFCFGTHCPCANDASQAGCANSTGNGAKLARSSGSTSVAADDLELALTQAPANVPTLLFMGAQQVRQPFADGVRCAGGVPKRIQVAFADAQGSATFLHAASRASGLVVAGSTWHFQAWFRDLAGPCHTGFGLSSALQITFAP